MDCGIDMGGGGGGGRDGGNENRLELSTSNFRRFIF